MSRARLVVGLIACLMLVLSACAHSIFGWGQLSAQVASHGLPADLLQTLGIGWRWGGVAMVAFGVTAAWELLAERRVPAPQLRACLVTGVTYVLFGIGAIAVSKSPFFLVFVVPGLMLLFAGWPRARA